MFRAEADASPHYVAVDLVYTADTSCHLITEMPSSNAALTTQLLPTTMMFHGNLQLSKAASGDGCTLYLAMKGAVSPTSSEPYDVYRVAQCLHEQMKDRLNTKELENVALARVTVELDDNKQLAAALSTEGLNEPLESVLMIQQGACTEMLSALKSKDNADLLPRQVETNKLDVIQQAGKDEAASCAVRLEIAALVPCLSADVEVFQLLNAVDEKMRSFFVGQPNTTLDSANVLLLVASDGQKVVATKKDDVTKVMRNLPSYEEAMGIFALVAVLVAMLMGIVIQKKRNEKHSRDQYERANRAAQIHRVSFSMRQHDQEAQEHEGEEDSLL